MAVIVMSIAVLAGLFMAWIIGAASASPAFGPVNSAGAVSIFRGSFIAGFAALLGAVTQGEAVASTMRSGIITGTTVDPVLASMVLVVASLLMGISIAMRYPMPAVFTVVGGVIGAGMAAGGSIGAATVQRIGLFWLLIPFAALGISYMTVWMLQRYVPETERAETSINTVLLLLATYTAYTAGANQAGLAVGPLQNVVDIPMLYLLVFAGVGMMVGAWTGSPRMIEAVARDYSKMGPRQAIAALLAASSLAQVATLFGVPVSFNEAIVSAIIGAGLIEGTTGISRRKIGWTVLGWIGAFAVATAVAYTVTAAVVSL